MMNNYKIRIGCTTNNQLCCNNKRIDKKEYIKNNVKYIANKFDYVVSSHILYKTGNRITFKTLEFVCNTELNDNEFLVFINAMHNIGFNSNTNCNIEFFDIYNKKSKIVFSFQTKKKGTSSIYSKKK